MIARAISLAAILAVMVSLSVPTIVHAESIPLQIEFTGLQFLLDAQTQEIFDAESSNSVRADLDPTKSDELTSVVFNFGDLTEIDSTNVFADLYIKDANEIPAGGGDTTTGGNGTSFGLDLFGTSDAEGPWSLEMDFDSLQVTWVDYPMFSLIGLFGEVSNIAGNNLPFGLNLHDFSQPITFSASASRVWDVDDDGTYLTTFKASGTGNITATLVPEPSTLISLLMASITVFSVWVRRRA